MVFGGNGQVSFLAAGICHTMYCVMNPKGECQVGTKTTRPHADQSASSSADAEGDADTADAKGDADAADQTTDASPNASTNAAQKGNANAFAYSDAYAAGHAEKGNAHSAPTAILTAHSDAKSGNPYQQVSFPFGTDAILQAQVRKASGKSQKIPDVLQTVSAP